MDAIRCKGQQRGFRVGEILFRYDMWTPVPEVTDDMRVEGMLEIVVDCTGPDDPRLFPFALVTEDDCPPVTLAQIGERLQGLEADKAALAEKVALLEADKAGRDTTLATLEADKAGLGEQVNTLNQQIVGLQSQVGTMQATDAAQKRQIADLTRRVGELENAAIKTAPVDAAPLEATATEAAPAAA
jgi:uncharacterized protein YoxC